VKVKGIKMKKKKKNSFAIQKKRIFFTALFGLIFWLCISKMICRAREGAHKTF